MTAIAVRDTRPSRRLGMKILAAVLTIVCLVQLLIAFEEVRTVAALRAVQAGAPTERAGDWIGQAWSNLVRAVNPAPPVLAEPEDRLLTGRFVAATEGTGAPASVAFAGADIVLNGAETLETRPLRIAPGADAVSRDETFADAWNAAPDAQIELREVVAGEASPKLCGATAPSSLALLYRGQVVDLMLFRATPGAEAEPTVVCARWTLKAG
ncbi:MAG: hypothetical protein EON90_12795 [Brevundimonas sp.]|nr:MAG: hypothetical protein EON90_12795 [Brevundimonas sp.]